MSLHGRREHNSMKTWCIVPWKSSNNKCLCGVCSKKSENVPVFKSFHNLSSPLKGFYFKIFFVFHCACSRVVNVFCPCTVCFISHFPIRRACFPLWVFLQRVRRSPRYKLSHLWNLLSPSAQPTCDAVLSHQCVSINVSYIVNAFSVVSPLTKRWENTISNNIK